MRDILRHATHTGRPLGSQDFVEALEELTSRPLAHERFQVSPPGFRDMGSPCRELSPFSLSQFRGALHPSVPGFPATELKA